MHLPIGSVLSITGTGVRVFKWWRTRQQRIARNRRLRQALAAVGLLAAMAGAITGIAILAHRP